MNAIDLQGRAAVVTGGAKGLGFAVAKRLLASGASVALWDLDRAKLEAAATTLGGQPPVLTQVVDVSDEGGVAAAMAAAHQRFGRIDILVNNAGIGGPNREITEISVEEWRHVFEINATGTFLCMRAAIPIMRQAGYGRIVNIASVNAKEGNPKTSPYSASKAAVVALTKSVAKEVAKTGILINCVTPASIKTDFLAERSKEHLDAVLTRIPLGRFAEADEIASMVAWLCSEEITYSTAAIFDLSGGRATY